MEINLFNPILEKYVFNNQNKNIANSDIGRFEVAMAPKCVYQRDHKIGRIYAGRGGPRILNHSLVDVGGKTPKGGLVLAGILNHHPYIYPPTRSLTVRP